MPGQGREGEGMAGGIIAKWQGGRKKGRLGRIDQSPCLSPVPGDCESLLTGIMLNQVEGTRKKTVL